MKCSRSIFLKLALSALLFFVFSCSQKGPTLQKITQLPNGSLCRVAVLPFANNSGYAEADLIVYRIFSAELVRTGNFQLAQEGDIRGIFQQLMIYPNQTLRLEQLRIIADRLDAQILITGTIEEMSQKSSGNSLNPTLTIDLQIVEADSGRILWLTHHKSEGKQYRKVMHFGLVNTITELIRIVSNEIVELWYDNGLKKCIS